MKIYNEDTLIKGWFIGNFNPTLFKTESCEVAVKRYKKGDFESSHHHKIATEITYIITGSVKMNKNILKQGDIVVIEPNESTDFVCIDDTITVVVKLPGANNDKYLD